MLLLRLLLPQGAAEVGGATDAEGRLLELSAAAPWRQALLKKLTLAGNDKKSNLQVREGLRFHGWFACDQNGCSRACVTCWHH